MGEKCLKNKKNEGVAGREGGGSGEHCTTGMSVSGFSGVKREKLREQRENIL